MDIKCTCGGHISSYINFGDLAECFNCHNFYVLINGKWKNVSRIDFRVLYRRRLINCYVHG